VRLWLVLVRVTSTLLLVVSLVGAFAPLYFCGLPTHHRAASTPPTAIGHGSRACPLTTQIRIELDSTVLGVLANIKVDW
jgi:hypothetical protein